MEGGRVSALLAAQGRAWHLAGRTQLPGCPGSAAPQVGSNLGTYAVNNLGTYAVNFGCYCVSLFYFKGRREQAGDIFGVRKGLLYLTKRPFTKGDQNKEQGS